jgi:hypothetical protein
MLRDSAPHTGHCDDPDEVNHKQEGIQSQKFLADVFAAVTNILEVVPEVVTQQSKGEVEVSPQQTRQSCYYLSRTYSLADKEILHDCPNLHHSNYSTLGLDEAEATLRRPKALLGRL